MQRIISAGNMLLPFLRKLWLVLSATYTYVFYSPVKRVGNAILNKLNKEFIWKLRSLLLESVSNKYITKIWENCFYTVHLW